MRHLSALLLSTLGLAANAQVVLTHGQVPTGTVTDRLYAVTAQGSAQMPTDGANQTWDLSSATLMEIGTFTHGPASATPYAASHPTANMAWHMDMGLAGSNYTYLEVTTSGISIVATDLPNDPEVYTDPWQVMAFPLDLNGSFSDPWEDTDESGTITWTYSGHGTAITAAGTFTNVVKMVSDDNDMVLWRTSPLLPLLLSVNGNLLLVGSGTNGMAEHRTEHLSVYPVPCADRLHVAATAAAPWRIFDIQGRTVAEGRFTQAGIAVVDTEALRPGAYVLYLADATGPRTAHFVKQ